MIRHKPQAEYASSDADLVYGARIDGTIVHISEVPSGAVCGCRCPSMRGEVWSTCAQHGNSRDGPAVLSGSRASSDAKHIFLLCPGMG
jgi:hypothetical protein